MCIDNLGASTWLNAPFPSYDFLQILFPNIYNTLNYIDISYNNGHYGNFEDESKKVEFIVGELEKTMKELIKKKN